MIDIFSIVNIGLHGYNAYRALTWQKRRIDALDTTPVEEVDHLIVNTQNDVRTLRRTDYASGVDEMRRLVQVADHEEAWLYLPQRGEFLEAGKNEIVSLDEGAMSVSTDIPFLLQSSLRFGDIVPHHIHPNTNRVLVQGFLEREIRGLDKYLEMTESDYIDLYMDLHRQRHTDNADASSFAGELKLAYIRYIMEQVREDKEILRKKHSEVGSDIDLADQFPSTADITAMIATSQLHQRGRPWVPLKSRIVASYGITEYGLTQEAIGILNRAAVDDEDSKDAMIQIVQDYGGRHREAVRKIGREPRVPWQNSQAINTYNLVARNIVSPHRVQDERNKEVRLDNAVRSLSSRYVETQYIPFDRIDILT